MPFRRASTNQPLNSWSTSRGSRQATDRSWESLRRRRTRGAEVGRPIWENRFSGLSLGRKVGQTCYIRGSFSRRANQLYSTDLFEGFLHDQTRSTDAQRRWRVTRASGLVCWKCEVEELNRISTSIPRKRARGWDSFGNTQSRAKIRTLVQSRNAI